MFENPACSPPIIVQPTFPVMSTAKNKKNKKLFEEVFENWETIKLLFEKTSKKIEFVIVDAGENAGFPVSSVSKLPNLTKPTRAQTQTLSIFTVRI